MVLGFEPLWSIGGSPGSVNAPQCVCDDEHFFVAGMDDVRAIAARSGKEIWRTDTTGSAGAVSLSGAMLYIAANSDQGYASLVALDSRTGGANWQITERGRVMSGLAVEGRVVAVFLLTSIKLADGSDGVSSDVLLADSVNGAELTRIHLGQTPKLWLWPNQLIGAVAGRLLAATRSGMTAIDLATFEVSQFMTWI